MRWIDQSEYVSTPTTLTYDLPVLLVLPGPELPGVVRLGIIWEGSPGRGIYILTGTRLFLLWVLTPIWPGMVWPTFFLWPEGHDRPGPMDGSGTGTESWPGAPQWLCHHCWPWIRKSQEVLPRCGPGTCLCLYRLPTAKRKGMQFFLQLQSDSPEYDQHSGVYGTQFASRPGGRDSSYVVAAPRSPLLLLLLQYQSSRHRCGRWSLITSHSVFFRRRRATMYKYTTLNIGER